MPSLLGIDNGLTVTKAVIFDADGTQLAVARRRVPQLMPHPRFVERDMAGLWRATAEAIAEAISLSGRPASDVKAVAATAHGDGVYLLDGDRRPLGAGILSLDSRAGAVIERWSSGSVAEEALALTGQEPHVSAPSALLAWIKQYEPERYRRIAHVLACKDWLRFCLTGVVGADRTEASTSFTDVRTQAYAPEALRIFGLEELSAALPPISHSAETVGFVTAEAAALTGLVERTPVACGLHDVTASALGMGGHREGVVSVVAGTYSINEVVSAEPKIDRRWFCRNAIDAGRWNNMSISPASTANYDWFLDTLCRAEQDRAAGGRRFDPCATGERDRRRLGAAFDDPVPSLSVRLAPWRGRQRQLSRAARLARSRRHAEGRAGRHRLQPSPSCRGVARRLCGSRSAADRRRLPQSGPRADVRGHSRHAGDDCAGRRGGGVRRGPVRRRRSRPHPIRA